MRVGLLLGPSTGGMGQHVASLALRLSEAGCDITVAGPASTRERFGFGVPFVPLEIGGPKLRQLGVVAAARPLVGSVDVVHAHGYAAGYVTAAAIRRRPNRPAFVVTWHQAVLEAGLAGATGRGMQRGVAKRADVVLGASSDLVEQARRLGASDARLAPVAAPPLSAPRRTVEEVRLELGAGIRPLVLAIGKLDPPKVYDLLLDVADRLRRHDPAPLFAVAGDGSERGRLAARIDADLLPVQLLGHRTDVADLLAAADAVLLTSRWEARPAVAQEALRAGVPLVATAVGGVPELVGDAALLVPYETAEQTAEQTAETADQLAAALARVLDEPMLARRLAMAGPEQASTWPDEDDTAAHLLAIYHELSGRT